MRPRAADSGLGTMLPNVFRQRTTRARPDRTGKCIVEIHRWSDPCLSPGMRDPKSTPVWIAVAFVVAGCLGIAVLVRGAKHAHEQERLGAQATEPRPLPTLAPRK